MLVYYTADLFLYGFLHHRYKKKKNTKPKQKSTRSKIIIEPSFTRLLDELFNRKTDSI